MKKRNKGRDNSYLKTEKKITYDGLEDEGDVLDREASGEEADVKIYKRGTRDRDNHDADIVELEKDVHEESGGDEYEEDVYEEPGGDEYEEDVYEEAGGDVYEEDVYEGAGGDVYEEDVYEGAGGDVYEEDVYEESGEDDYEGEKLEGSEAVSRTGEDDEGGDWMQDDSDFEDMEILYQEEEPEDELLDLDVMEDDLPADKIVEFSEPVVRGQRNGKRETGAPGPGVQRNGKRGTGETGSDVQREGRRRSGEPGAGAQREGRRRSGETGSDVQREGRRRSGETGFDVQREGRRRSGEPGSDVQREGRRRSGEPEPGAQREGKLRNGEPTLHGQREDNRRNGMSGVQRSGNRRGITQKAGYLMEDDLFDEIDQEEIDQDDDLLEDGDTGNQGQKVKSSILLVGGVIVLLIVIAALCFVIWKMGHQEPVGGSSLDGQAVQGTETAQGDQTPDSGYASGVDGNQDGGKETGDQTESGAGEGQTGTAGGSQAAGGAGEGQTGTAGGSQNSGSTAGQSGSGGISESGQNRTDTIGGTQNNKNNIAELPGSGTAEQGQTVVSMTFEEVKDTVTAKEMTNLRSEPSTEKDHTVVLQLKNGQTVTRTGINYDTGWSRLDYEGQTLYAVSRFLTTDLTSKLKEASSNTAVVSTDPNTVITSDGRTVTFTDCDDIVSPKMAVNLRGEPSTAQGNASIHVYLEYRNNVRRTGISEDTGWSRVEYNGEVLYAVTSYLYEPEETQEE